MFDDDFALFGCTLVWLNHSTSKRQSKRKGNTNSQLWSKSIKLLNIKLFIGDFCIIRRISRLSGDRELTFEIGILPVISGGLEHMPLFMFLLPAENSCMLMSKKIKTNCNKSSIYHYAMFVPKFQICLCLIFLVKKKPFKSCQNKPEFEYKYIRNLTSFYEVLYEDENSFTHSWFYL